MGLHLSNQDYSICVRNERNFCGIQYTQCADEGKLLLHPIYHLLILCSSFFGVKGDGLTVRRPGFESRGFY